MTSGDGIYSEMTAESLSVVKDAAFPVELCILHCLVEGERTLDEKGYVAPNGISDSARTCT